MPSVGFEPAIPATRLVQTYASDLMATEFGTVSHMHDLHSVESKTNMNIGIDVEGPANKFPRRDLADTTGRSQYQTHLSEAILLSKYITLWEC